MRDRGEEGSIVTLMCDGGERYLDTYYDREWVKSEIGDIEPYTSELERLS
jgi:cysteine synthase A